MSRRRCAHHPCGCERGCPIFQDDFNRANSTNIGSGLEEAWGDSSIVDNTLRVPAAGLVIGTRAHPWGSRDLGQTGLVVATAKDLQEGKKFQVCINAWEHPASGWAFLYGMLECGEDDNATISVSGGHSVDGLPYTPGQDAVLQLCRSEHGLYFDVSLGSAIAWACQEDNSGRKAGVGNPGEVDVEFDDYHFGEAWWTNPICPKCECECFKTPEYFCIEKNLLLTFSASRDCSCLDGASIPLEWDEDRPGDWLWEGEKELPDYQCPEPMPTRNYRFELQCANWRLWMLEGLSSCSGGWTQMGERYYADPASIECDPLTLTYGPFTCDWSCMPVACVCEYYIVITPPA